MPEIFLHLIEYFDHDSLLFVLDRPDSKWAWYVLLFFTSFIKFAIAAVTALAEPNLSYLEFFLTVGGGALVSVVFYTYFGEQVRTWILRLLRRDKKKEEKESKGHPKLDKIWNRFGLAGVAFLAPFLSPMLSVGVAVSFREKPLRIILAVGISVIFWTVVFAVLRDQLIDMAREINLIK